MADFFILTGSGVTFGGDESANGLLEQQQSL